MVVDVRIMQMFIFAALHHTSHHITQLTTSQLTPCTTLPHLTSHYYISHCSFTTSHLISFIHPFTTSHHHSLHHSHISHNSFIHPPHHVTSHLTTSHLTSFIHHNSPHHSSLHIITAYTIHTFVHTPKRAGQRKPSLEN